MMIPNAQDKPASTGALYSATGRKTENPDRGVTFEFIGPQGRLERIDVSEEALDDHPEQAALALAAQLLAAQHRGLYPRGRILVTTAMVAQARTRRRPPTANR